VLSVFDQCRSDAESAVLAIGDEHAELSNSFAQEIDVHRPDEYAVDFGQDQHSSAEQPLDLAGTGPRALPPPHAPFGVVIDLVDQVREPLDVVSLEI
jgi:hypothetical protein